MAEENFSKTHTEKRREYCKNGDVYVFERITAYDPEKKQTVTVKEKLLGKISAGEHEISPTRPKCRTSGIDRDVLSSFPAGDAEKSCPLHDIGYRQRQSLPRLETWQIPPPLPYSGIIREDI